jgi:hypothetical protein
LVLLDFPLLLLPFDTDDLEGIVVESEALLLL